MQKTTLPVGIKTMLGWKNKGTLTFDNPIQRAGSQWSLLQKSLLVHSVIMGYPIPACYFIKTKNNEGETAYDVLDAKQRLTSLFEFIEGEYALHAATPTCECEGFTFDLANLKFEEFADDLKDAILGARLSIFCLEECTDEEVEEIFARLNNSTPLSPIQKCRSIMSSELSKWTKEMCKSDFFAHSIGLTVAQLRREADLEVLLQTMLLLDARTGEYTDWKAISTAEVTKYCQFIRGNYCEKKRDEIFYILEYLSEAFPEQHKFLKKSNIPMVMVLSQLAMENDISSEKFKIFIDSFSNAICPAYEANTGSGNVKRPKTEGRLQAIAKAFSDYFGLGDVNILGVKASDENEENCEIDEPEGSFVGGDEAEAENFEGQEQEAVELGDADAADGTSDEGVSDDENSEDSGVSTKN